MWQGDHFFVKNNAEIWEKSFCFVLFTFFFFFCVKAKSEKTYLFRSPSQEFHPSPLYSIIIFIIVEAVSCTEQWRNGDSELQVNGFSPLFQTPSAAKIIFSRPKSLTRVIPLEGRIVLWSFFLGYFKFTRVCTWRFTRGKSLVMISL